MLGISHSVFAQQEKSVSTTTHKLTEKREKELQEIKSMVQSLLPVHATDATSTIWTLEKCIAYAVENNLQISAAVLNERMANLVYQQSKYSRLPSLNGDASLGDSYGRSIDPTSSQLVTKGFLYNSIGLSSNALLFGWFQKKYQIEQYALDQEATVNANKQLQDDIALNVATGFLRVLLAREQVKVSEAQLKLDNDQYTQTVQFVNAGKLPELNALQMESQLASDSSRLVSTQSDERIALLQLKAILNLNFEQSFNIAAPAINMEVVSSLDNLPIAEVVYNIAIQNQHSMKANTLKLLSAYKTLAIAKAMQYPQLSIQGTLGTNFSSNVKDIKDYTYVGQTTVGYVSVAGTDYPITQPDYKITTQTRPFSKQYTDNIRANIGLGLSIPIFNGYVYKTNIQKAKIGLVNQQFVIETDKQKLKQNIYTAYEEAKSSSQKYVAAIRAESTSQRAVDFAVKRYAVGMINMYEYTSIVNNLYMASSSVLSSKYDLIFKLKVLDYYMGHPIKL